MFLINNRVSAWRSYVKRQTAGKGKNKLYKAIESNKLVILKLYMYNDSFDIRKKI
jgi:hypothetical protein